MFKKFLSFNNNIKLSRPVSFTLLLTAFIMSAFAVVVSSAAYAAPRAKPLPSVSYDQSAYRWFDSINTVTGFDGDGIINGPADSNTATAIAKDSTHMYVTGHSATGYWRIEKRSLATGELDATFDGDGIVHGGVSGLSRSIAIDSTHMYVAGANYTSNVWRIEKRSLATGELDATFDGDGIVDGPGVTYANALAIDASHMYVVGNSGSPGNSRIEKRSLATGELDATFDGDGIVDGLPESNFTTAVAIDSGYMYVSGTNDNINWRIEKRSLATGELDATFDGDGIVDGLAASNNINAVTTDGSALYVVGDNSLSKWRIEKRSLATGELDATFDGDGIVDGLTASRNARSIATDTTNMYVAGNNYSGNFRIEKRSLATGELDATFDGDGIVDGLAASSDINAITIDTSDLYVAGKNDSNDIRIEKRNLASGSLGSSVGPEVGASLSPLNTSATAPTQGTPFRLRMNVHIGNTSLAQSGQSFKLQFAGKGAGTCAAPSGAPSSYTDVTSSTAIKYYNNSNSSDGLAFTANSNDPTHASDVLKRQTYEESNNFTNSISAINVGEDGMWDFALADNSAPAGASYCFKVVKSDGTAINTYTQYPIIVTAN